MTENNSFDLSTVIDQAIQVITKPVEFYRSMPKTGGLSEPLIFLLVMAAASGVLTAILAMLNLLPMNFGVGMGMILFLPIMALVGGFIGAAILFVIWKLMGSEHDYETAYRCVAYSAAIWPVVTVLGAIPYLGTAIRVVWGTYLMVVASIEVHGRQQNPTYIVFGILGLLGLLVSWNGERAQRQMASSLEQYSESLEKSMQNMEDMTPEEAGKAVGEFLRGMQEAAEQAEQSN